MTSFYQCHKSQEIKADRHADSQEVSYAQEASGELEESTNEGRPRSANLDKIEVDGVGYAGEVVVIVRPVAASVWDAAIGKRMEKRNPAATIRG